MSPLADIPSDLDPRYALDDFWQRWTDGVSNRHSLFHTPTVATTGLNGEPTVRTVVLRAASQSDRDFRFHTDRRSRKFEELLAKPSIGLHVYDRDAAIQVRVWGSATIHTDDDLADQAWAESRAFSRLCYGSNAGPGAIIPAPFAAPVEIDQDFARGNFAAVRIVAEQLEWLHLRAKGHQRLGFTWRDGDWHSQWLAP